MIDKNGYCDCYDSLAKCYERCHSYEMPVECEDCPYSTGYYTTIQDYMVESGLLDYAMQTVRDTPLYLAIDEDKLANRYFKHLEVMGDLWVENDEEDSNNCFFIRSCETDHGPHVPLRAALIELALDAVYPYLTAIEEIGDFCNWTERVRDVMRDWRY